MNKRKHPETLSWAYVAYLVLLSPAIAWFIVGFLFDSYDTGSWNAGMRFLCFITMVGIVAAIVWAKQISDILKP